MEKRDAATGSLYLFSVGDNGKVFPRVSLILGKAACSSGLTVTLPTIPRPLAEHQPPHLLFE